MMPELLLTTAIKTSGIVALALGAVAVLRGRSAALRHWILAAAFVCAATVPMLERVMPVWQVPTESAWKNAVVAQGFSPAAPARSPEGLRHVLSRSTARRDVMQIPEIVLAVWLAGALVALLTLLIGLTRLAWITSRADDVRAEGWQRVALDLSREYGLRPPVRLLRSAHPTLLATWGWLRPCVLVPRGAEAWSEQRIRIVLLHELAHVARGDWAMQMIAAMVRAAYWFNPLVWLAGHRLLQESERAADDAVLNRGVDGATYASELLTLARAFGPYQRQWAPAPGIVRHSTLQRRVAAMLNARANRRPPSRGSKILTALALAAAAIGIASAQTAFSSLSGAVYDPQNGLLPDVRMTLTNDQSGAKYEIRSDSSGRFQFVGLPPGRYVLETELMGFKTLRGALDISGAGVQRDLRLDIGSLEETVSVDLPRPGEVPPPPVGRRPSVATSFAGRACTPSPVPGGIGGNLRPPTKLVSAYPIYPPALAAAREGGVVVLDARIGTDGTIQEVRTLSSPHPDLDAAAADAVRQWVFSETLLNCLPVEVEMRVTVRFNPE